VLFAVSLLPACALQPVVEAEYPPGVYAVEGQYIWDSWIVEDEGTLHRYALSAPTEGYGPNDRHQHAFVRHATSRDGGRSWKDLGPAIEPQPKGTWPDHVIWTSSVMLRKDAKGEKEFLMFITGRSGGDNDWTQQIGLARSRDGHNFSVPEVILSPEESHGYDITEATRSTPRPCSRRRAEAMTLARSPSSPRTQAAPSPAPRSSTSTGTPKGSLASNSTRTMDKQFYLLLMSYLIHTAFSPFKNCLAGNIENVGKFLSAKERC
jgi:hypothetical protein